MSGALALVSVPAFAFALAFASASVFRLGLVHISTQPLYLYGISPLLLSSSLFYLYSTRPLSFLDKFLSHLTHLTTPFLPSSRRDECNNWRFGLVFSFHFSYLVCLLVFGLRGDSRYGGLDIWRG